MNFNVPFITLVIEDKTESNEHNQLKTYNNRIEKWDYKDLGPEKCVYKIFYKTNRIGEEELERVKKSGWSPFNLKAIYEFFNDRGNTKSQIFNDYVDHIIRLYNASNGDVDDLDVLYMDVLEWDGVIRKYFSYLDTEDSSIWVDGYQGRYISICYQKLFPNKNGIVLEILIRNKTNFSTLLHHSFYYGDEKHRVWHVNKIPKEEFKSKAIEIREYLKNFVSKYDNNIVCKVRNNASGCFGKFKETEKIEKVSDGVNIINHWIKYFEELYHSVEFLVL